MCNYPTGTSSLDTVQMQSQIVNKWVR
jgi:hypothetical protein